ncbi:hypothetical protein BDV25DRAFT_152261 [Aspergillus avenaceus]|uniref:Phosphatidate phosphatase APP1 catalytic domain-containing protein n=1 Tax=Aspergillus avenaceus TaxID=36643 RepID=A0A5N6TZE8_ASPAV|nr:hypothetical protein BDV25DRAFT_152261 [Aspergillus avenaceus]
MSQYLPSTSWAGGRRKKVFEYLKAANELRQTYAAQWASQINPSREYDEEYLNSTPGAFPDVEIARAGDEEMVIFPSYARRLDRNEKPFDAPQRRGSTSTIDEYRGVDEETEWERLEREILEDKDAIVALDVRGWVYSPHRGPMTRKHRLMVALARRLTGIPAPSNDEGTSADAAKLSGRREDELVDSEAQTIIRNAEGHADAAWKSEHDDEPRHLQRTTSDLSQLTKDELSMANAHLMERLRPFLTNPRNQLPVTVFFFNNGKSQSRSVLTDESGHFTLRTALPFIPTHIRVLASEDLSAMKPVQIIEPTGVSLISDIDDTVKHSAIASGAKEIFRNTFVRELDELIVDGVSSWYSKLAQMGVQIHYVSNSPWQLYPLLERYFKLAGLPPGSFHLKQYSGMLQGIFEPTAERKKGNLEQLLRDFPSRRFILVGDSGEADLEVYTDIALANPGRILGIFIRDVTTAEFFDKSSDYLERTQSTPQLHRPALPPRPRDAMSIDNADLIDLDEPSPRPPPAKPSKPSSLRTVSTPDPLHENIKRKPHPPLPPRRSSPSKESLPIRSKTTSEHSKPKPPPPPPPRRSTTHTNNTQPNNKPQSQSPAQTPPQSQPQSQNQPQNQKSYPTAAATAALQYASERLNWPTPSPSMLRGPQRQPTAASTDQEMPAPVPNKREELWRRRWERAHDTLVDKGVVLGSWRVGRDAEDVSLWLVREALKKS